ncbi:anti-sigma factor family protein [Trinickia fusca]|uniref:Anti-sigma factor n=1 Tax=Trinickia fusca TaxID=2419777 RepID=A0A494XCQ5_9BURK|nr:anti-sigma factor [Trinickia fusca]RKP45924.1 anti-sigma factor [Trinickia fusca]
MNERPDPFTEDDIHAYVDSLLPEAQRIEIERALERDPALAARVSDYFAQNTLFHERYDRVLQEPLPQRLRQAAVPSHRPAANWRHYAGLAAALVLGIGIGVGTDMQLHPPASPQVASDATRYADATQAADPLPQQAAIAHVLYMPAVERPAQLGSQNEQQFVRWLAQRLGTDVKPPVLSRSGFELMGGRLLHTTDGPTALFMYRDAAGERVTLYISRRTTSLATTAFKLYRDGPVNVFYWIDGDFGYAISGGIDRRRLLALSHDVYKQITAAQQG